jgi:hypothetical protein
MFRFQNTSYKQPHSRSASNYGILLLLSLTLFTLCQQAHCQQIDLKNEGKNAYSFSLNPEKLTLKQMSAELDDISGDSVTTILKALRQDGTDDTSIDGTYWVKANGTLTEVNFVGGRGTAKFMAAKQSSIVFSNLQDEPLFELSLFSWFKIAQKAVVFAVLFYVFRFILSYIQKRMYKPKTPIAD